MIREVNGRAVFFVYCGAARGTDPLAKVPGDML